MSRPNGNPLRDPIDRRLPRVAGPSGLVIFGVTGDLSRKKLMPAVYDLANRGLLPPGFSLVGFARREWQDEDFAQEVHDAVKQHARTPFREEVWQQLIQGMRFVQGNFDDDDAFETLKHTIQDLDKSQGTGGNFAFYLSVPPKFFPQVVQQLKKHGLADAPDGSWRRAVIEKPFGHDLASAKELNAIVHEVFDPDQVFRIDHYLGKETVQNILALRFANQMFEPIWNRSYVDHVQITMAEDIGIGGRAGYYDGIGAARDVIQNHLLQLMALTAMEEPASFDADALVAEKAKVLGAIRLPKDLGKDTVRGQYAVGWQGVAWTRLTPWRSALAAALDQAEVEVTSATVEAEAGNPSAELLARWLQVGLGRSIDRKISAGPVITGVRLGTADGEIVINRSEGPLATLTLPGQPTHSLALKIRSTSELISEELRRLDADEMYAIALRGESSTDTRHI
ncbi:glucose-6-phosphate dehydrogenase assembly protein OpcA [Streptomyces sp. VRA16 Mangrove soil]|nr:glucose-6-phosphate dehydrogenase assembly protein OpcA [Streptomyces sp. VRA16 Mangrove soil]